jgi:uncharacterized membrane protein
MDTPKKSLLKTVTWQLVHMTMVAGTIFLLTGEWEIAGIAALAELFWESALYFVHERLWTKFGNKVK